MTWTIDREVLRAYCAGIVHDIGKVWAQVPGRGTEPSQFHCQTPEQHRLRFADCPSCLEAYRYAHGPLGANLLAETIPDHPFLAEVAARHHAPQAADFGDLLRWVTLGDHLSAGERDERYDVRSDSAPPPALLNPLAERNVYIRPGPLDSRLLFGRLDSAQQVGEAREAFTSVFDALKKALSRAGRAAGNDLLTLSEHLTGAVYRGTIGVPSAFSNAVADIPLATHLHLAGAFAAALAADGSPARSIDEASVGIIAGDVSGIQDFIHDTGSRRAARSLRARSFYIQLLSLVAARWVAIECRVPPGCAFSVVGGRFLVAVPASAIEQLDDLQARLDGVLWRSHGPTLSVGLAGVARTGAAMASFRELYEELQQQLAVRKAHRYEALAQSGALFEPQDVLPAGRACRTCGREAIDGRSENDDGVERRVCAMCASLEDLGRSLVESSYVLLRPAGGRSRNGWLRVMAELGHSVELNAEPPTDPSEGAVFALDDDALSRYPSARYLPTARHVPRGEDGLLDFEEIARRGRGRPSIAILKADVDDLGSFLRGYFERRPASPSRFLAISTALSLFFEAHLPQYAAKNHQSLYLVFSGGDDTALAGPLWEVVQFALSLRDQFSQWTAGNPHLHFSAGISAAHAHRPVQSGMEEAEDYLTRAKRYVRPGLSSKNAVCMLDVLLDWQGLKEVAGWTSQLEALVMDRSQAGGRAMPRGALQHLQRLRDAEPGVYTRLHWWSFYQFNRLAGDNPAAAQLLKELRRQALEPDGAGGSSVALAARLAEFLTATTGEGDNP